MVEPHEQCAESTKMENGRNVSETPAPADEQTHVQPEVCVFTPFFQTSVHTTCYHDNEYISSLLNRAPR